LRRANSSNFTTILSFYRSKSHSFQNPKKPGFRFSATRNPGLPRIGNTTRYHVVCKSVPVGFQTCDKNACFYVA